MMQLLHSWGFEVGGCRCWTIEAAESQCLAAAAVAAVGCCCCWLLLLLLLYVGLLQLLGLGTFDTLAEAKEV